MMDAGEVYTKKHGPAQMGFLYRPKKNCFNIKINKQH